MNDIRAFRKEFAAFKTEIEDRVRRIEKGQRIRQEPVKVGKGSVHADKDIKVSADETQKSA